MRPSLFLDASGWVAAILARQSRHAEAAELYRATLRASGVLVTTNLVVAETHTIVMREAGVAAALELLDDVASDASHEIVYATSDLQSAAVDRWLRPYREHRFSLTDAVSFEVMRQRGLRRALALDRHFVTAGYEIL